MTDKTQDDLDEPISKTQRKREMTALQNLGKTLIELSDTMLKKCELPDELLSAIAEYKRLPNKNEARRRQLQYIGKHMRNVDTDAIERTLNRSRHSVELEKRKFHELEVLREELIAGGNDSLNQLISDFPEIDIQRLRQLIRQSQKELSLNKPPTTSKKLFKYLREFTTTD